MATPSILEDIFTSSYLLFNSVSVLRYSLRAAFSAWEWLVNTCSPISSPTRTLTAISCAMQITPCLLKQSSMSIVLFLSELQLWSPSAPERLNPSLMTQHQLVFFFFFFFCWDNVKVVKSKKKTKKNKVAACIFGIRPKTLKMGHRFYFLQFSKDCPIKIEDGRSEEHQSHHFCVV